MSAQNKRARKKISGSKSARIENAPTRLSYLKRLLGLFRSEYKAYGWHILFLGVLSFFGGILEGFGITAIIPIFSFVNKGRAESTDFISQFIEKFFVFFHLPYTLKYLLLFILALFMSKAALVFAANQMAARITTGYEQITRRELFRSTLGSDWQYLSHQKIGYLSQILTNDVSNSSALLTYLSGILFTSINLAIYVALMFNVSAVIALLAIVFGAIVFFIIKPILKKNKVLSQEVSMLYKDAAHYVDEAMIGVKAIKAMRLEPAVGARGDVYFERLKTLIRRSAVLKNISTALLQPLGLCLIVSIFAYFYKTQAFNFASFAVIVYSMNKVFANVEIAQIQLNKISTVSPYLAAIAEHKRRAKISAEPDLGVKPFSFSNCLEFNRVSFAYAAGRQVLSNVSFSITRGQMVGVIGPSGSGKTTITDLILRLYAPDSGRIQIDGEPISSVSLAEWRSRIGYVSQESFLINDTVENNIKFYNDRIDRSAVIAAAKLANIHEFVEHLPERYNTEVGERGVKLSGGQRQRIILARVLATRPSVLILDEATSALDNESERLIQDALQGIKGSVTVIAVAHRLSTVMMADQLIVLEKGKIVEHGKPHDLLKNKESYLSRVHQLR